MKKISLSYLLLLPLASFAFGIGSPSKLDLVFIVLGLAVVFTILFLVEYGIRKLVSLIKGYLK